VRSEIRHYYQHAEFLLGLPYLPVLEIGGVFGPLLFHGLYGLVVTAEGDFAHPGHGIGLRYHNLAYLLQRISGVLLILFIILGIVCACYHFLHGLFNVAYKRGRTVSARAQHDMTYVSYVVFAAMGREMTRHMLKRLLGG
jgi:succinate dehydrogenase / fumarate reductase cytochrome b subunit